MFLRHRTIAVRCSRITLGFDEFVFNSARMVEGHQALTEALLNAHGEAATLQMALQKPAEPSGMDSANGADLTGPLTGPCARSAHRKAGDQATHITGVVAEYRCRIGSSPS